MRCLGGLFEFYSVKFIYTIDPEETRPIILINKHIGRITNASGEVEEGVMGEELQRELLELERMGKESVELWINSPGGVVSDGWSIYGTIRNTKLHVTGLNIGIAASTAGWIFEACHERIMMDYSIVMMHNPHGSNDSGQKEYTKSVATMLAARSGKTQKEIMALMKATTFMTADEAFKNGFCDVVRESTGVETAAVANIATTADSIWVQGNEILNSLLLTRDSPASLTMTSRPARNSKSMSQVTNLLNLGNDAGEAAIIAEIRKLQSRVNEMEDAEKENEDKLNEYENELAELKKRHEAEMNALIEKYDALNKAKEAAEKKRNEDDCRNMVETFVNTGRIKADSKDKWLHTARKLGVAEAKTLIESMPLNITAPLPLDAAQLQGIKTVVTNVDEWRDEWEEKLKTKK